MTNDIEAQQSSSERPWRVGGDGTVRLLASADPATGQHFFPPLPESSPQAQRFTTVSLAVEAMLYSHTTVHPNPKTGKVPFTLVYADFPERVRVLGRLKSAVDSRPQIGSTLRVELEEQADGSMDYVFSAVK